MVLLSLQNTCLNWWVRKLQFYTQNLYLCSCELSTVSFNFLLFIGNIEKQEWVGWDFMSCCLWFCVYLLCSLMEKTLASKQDLHQEVSIMVSYDKHGRILRGGTGSLDPLENHKWLKESLEILVWTPLKKELEQLGPIASQRRSVVPLWNTLTTKKWCPGGIFWVRPWLMF